MMADILHILAAGFAPLAFLVMTLICVTKIIRLHILRGSATAAADGVIKDISIPHHRWATRHYYEATLVFTAANGQHQTIPLSHRLETVDFFARHLGKTVDVTVFYTPGNPRRYYVKELTLPLWRYYMIAVILACCTVYFGWMMFFIF